MGLTLEDKKEVIKCRFSHFMNWMTLLYEDFCEETLQHLAEVNVYKGGKLEFPQDKVDAIKREVALTLEREPKDIFGSRYWEVSFGITDLFGYVDGKLLEDLNWKLGHYNEFNCEVLIAGTRNNTIDVTLKVFPD